MPRITTLGSCNKAIEVNREYTKRRNKIANAGRSTDTYEVGDRIYLRNPSSTVGVSRRLDKKWIGPFRIMQKKSPVVFKIKKIQGTNEITVHADRLKLSKVVVMSHNNITYAGKVDDDPAQGTSFGNVDNRVLYFSACLESQEEITAQLLEELVQSDRPAPPETSSHYHTRSHGPVPEQPWTATTRM